MSGIFQYFDFISHSEFTKQNNDKDIVIPISQIEKLRIDRFDNISQQRKNKLQSQDSNWGRESPKLHVLTYNKNKTKAE